MGCHIQVTDLALSYRWKTFEKTIFQDVDLCIESGSFVSITGKNGCGKSSLIKLMLGLIVPDKGQILLNGEAVRPGFPDAVKTKRISYLAQQIEELFYAETVSHELSYQQESSRSQQEQVLNKLGLAGFRDRSLESLSGGERQGVALAQFLMQDSPLLILDEPSSYLDNYRAGILKEYLDQAHHDGKTILHATQYQGELAWGTHVLDLDQPSLSVEKQ